MKRVFLLLIIIFATFSISIAQKKLLIGQIIDGAAKTPLSFANVRIDQTSEGTSANIQGEFQLRLLPGSYNLITSFIGYKSDTLLIHIKNNLNVTIELKSVILDLPEVTVLPGINPALEVIKRTIEAKRIRNEKLNSYQFNAYTKGLIKTTRDITTGDRSVGMSFGGFELDTADLKISGIIENESKGYYLKPENYKEEIVARKQSSNAPSSINILTGGRLIQNFYRDDIQFFGRPMLSPIAEDALDYYYYYIEDTLAMDNQNVFQIFFGPDDASDPGFFGRLFIEDSIFSLVQIDAHLNEAANPGGIFNKVNVFQQFLPYESDIYMPIDYRLFVEGNVFGIAKFGFEITSIFYDYKINFGIDEDFFDMAIITVLPEADSKDSSYWMNTQSIPNTLEELEAYERIDSLESIPITFWDRFSFLDTRFQITDNVSITGPLGLYHFNRVEGNALGAGAYTENLFNKRFNGDLELRYGFADKKLKSELSAEYYFGKYRTHSLAVNVFNKIDDLFSESINYNRLTSTLFNLISKYDFRDYYYSKGINVKLKSEIFPVVELGVGYFNRTDNSAMLNSDFSIFNKSKTYRDVKQIYETKINAIELSLEFDFRKFIEDGYFRRRVSGTNSIPILKLEALISDSKTLKSNLSFEIYKARLSGRLSSFKSAYFGYSISGVFSDGPTPFQMLYALPGNIESGGKEFTFRSLRIGEVYGDRVAMIGLKHDFRDEFFRLLNFPLLKDLQILFSTHVNLGWLNISNASRNILLEQPDNIFKSPFIEAGFSIGQMLLPIQFEFTWKVTHRGENNFVFGLNTFAL
jgi:uncharacterized protein DUF5686/carboxypeptidase-like protein